MCCGRGLSPTSRRSSACTNPSRSIRAAWAFWRAITSRARPTSDIPLVGIGLFYGQGYFRQHLDVNGWQKEEYLPTDVNQLPMEPAIAKNGEPAVVRIETRGAPIIAKVWRVKVGRCDLLLLDSNVEGNRPEDRELTSRLYGGDGRVASARSCCSASAACGRCARWALSPACSTSTKATARSALLEAFAQRMVEEGINFDEACAVVARQTCFTTHTPVPAGHDRFSQDLIEEHLGPLRDELGLSLHGLMALGRENPATIMARRSA